MLGIEWERDASQKAFTEKLLKAFGFWQYFFINTCLHGPL
jgi:hypothetical protein